MEVELKTFLESEGLPELIPRFVEHGITEDILVTLTDRDLEKIGVPTLGERKRMLKAFQAKKAVTSLLAHVDGGILPEGSDLAGQRVEPFMISKQRVGVQEWEVVKMWGAAQGYEIVGGKTDAVDGPLTHVNWYNALKWCNARSEKEGLLPVYRVLGGIYRKGEFGRDGSEAITWERTLRGYRLPLECEWEWAARGGLLHYEVDHTAQIEDESNVNKIGLCDMSGDVFDWCWDLDDSGPFRRTRGGNWRHECEVLSFGYRASVPPDSFSGVIGLRMAMDIEGELVEYKKPVVSPR
jgi:hypothetical protein